MAFVLAERVEETSTTTGTGTLNLAGATTNNRTFVAGIATGNTTKFIIKASDGSWERSRGTVTDASPDTLSRTLIESSTGSLLDLPAGTHTITCDWSAQDGLNAVFAAQAIIPGGRLTLESGVPVSTTDQTAKTNVYYTPYVNNIINLWDGADWRPTVFAETTEALGTLTSGLPYDVFGFLSSGVLDLEKLAWTNGTTRATAITLQDGRYCKSGDKTRLYLGTFYTTSTTTTEDSGGGVTTNVGAKRFLWNMYNRVLRTMIVHDTTATWSYTTATIRQARATAGNKVEFICGLSESLVHATLSVWVSVKNNTVSASAGLGLDSTTAYIGHQVTAYNLNSTQEIYIGLPAVYCAPCPLGYHYISWLELGANNTCVFVGNLSSTQSGVSGGVFA